MICLLLPFHIQLFRSKFSHDDCKQLPCNNEFYYVIIVTSKIQNKYFGFHWWIQEDSKELGPVGGGRSSPPTGNPGSATGFFQFRLRDHLDDYILSNEKSRNCLCTMTIKVEYLPSSLLFFRGI